MGRGVFEKEAAKRPEGIGFNAHNPRDLCDLPLKPLRMFRRQMKISQSIRVSASPRLRDERHNWLFRRLLYDISDSMIH